jgi:hypothetical protein
MTVNILTLLRRQICVIICSCSVSANGHRVHINAPILQSLSHLESALGNPNAACDGARLRYDSVSSHCRSRCEGCEQVRFCQVALGSNLMTQRTTLLFQHISSPITAHEKRLVVGQEHANNFASSVTSEVQAMPFECVAHCTAHMLS